MNVEQVVEEFLKLVNEGKVEQAEKLIVKQAKEREDELAGILLVTGAKIGDEGNHSVALRCFETARKIVKTEAMKELVVQSLGIAHNNYAILLYEINRFEEAEDHYKKALDINPEYAKAYGNLGILYSDQKKYSKAVKSLEKASKIFKEKNMLFDHKKAEGLKLSTQAKLLWREESWEDIKKKLGKSSHPFQSMRNGLRCDHM